LHRVGFWDITIVLVFSIDNFMLYSSDVVLKRYKRRCRSSSLSASSTASSAKHFEFSVAHLVASGGCRVN
jgi:hypothetical protein